MAMRGRRTDVISHRRSSGTPRLLAAAAAAVALAIGVVTFAVADGGDSAGPPAASAAPLCGASFLNEPEYGDTGYQEAFERVDGYYGLESVRLFYQQLPAPWPGKLESGDLPMIVSFKADPAEVLAGEHDEHLRQWFRQAPGDRDVYWSYFHEPEDNIDNGEFSAENYRDAWRYLKNLADDAQNPRLHASLILMSWTLEPESKRDWRDYIPDSDVIDVLAWDSYNQIEPDPKEYRPPAEIFGESVEVNRELGLPFAIAATGSGLVDGDDGSQRAQWLREVAGYLGDHGAIWVQYFDIDYTEHGHSDFRLRDDPGQSAWRDFCAA